MHQPARHRFYRFGPNVLDCLRGVLWQDGVEVPLTPRVFDILSTLVQRHGDLVTKDDFMQLVWGGVAVEDNNLARQISTLRKLLHERPGQREYIATVTGVGYRFVGAVTASDEVPEDLQQSLADASPAHGPPQSQTEPETAGSVDVPPGADDPGRHLPSSPAAAPPAAVPPTNALRWVTVLAGGLALAATVLLLVWRDAPTSAANVSRTLWQFTHDSGSQFEPAWSPDGTRLALASDRHGNADIWVHALGDSTTIQLTTSNAHDWQPHWSPDGRTIVFRSERDGGGIYVVPSGGGTERQLVPFGSLPRWSPDGRRVLFSQTSPDASVAVKLFVVPAGGGAPERVAHPALAGLQIGSAAWAPDGRISVWTRDEAGDRQFITFPLDGGPATRSRVPAEVAAVPFSTTTLSSFVWAPSGRYLYFEGRTRAVRNIWRVTVDPVTLDWIRGPEQLTIGPGADVGPAISPDGLRLSFGVNTARPGVWAFGFDPATGQLDQSSGQIISGSSGERGIDVANDGRRVVYRLDRDNRQEIWGRDIDGESSLLVSEQGWDVTVPTWSPDQRYITYQRRRRTPAATSDRRTVVVLDVTTPGRQPVEILTLGPGQDGFPTDWRSDGRALLTSCRLDPGDRVSVCELPLPASLDSAPGQPVSQRRLAADDRRSLYQQRYSPNGQWISFIAVPRADRSTSTVYVMPVTGGPWRPVTDGQAYDDKPRWSPDGRVLYFISNRDGRFDVWGRRFDPDTGDLDGRPFRVTAFEGARQALSPYLVDLEMFITPRRIFLPMAETSSRIWMLDQADR